MKAEIGGSKTDLEGGERRVISVLLFARTQTVEGGAAGERRRGHQGNTHSERKGADGHDDGDL